MCWLCVYAWLRVKIKVKGTGVRSGLRVNKKKSRVILQFSPEGIYRDIAALPRKVAAVNWFAVDISICLRLSESQICIFWVRTIVVSTLRVSTTKNSTRPYSTYPWRSLLNMLSKSRTQGWLAALETWDLTQEKKPLWRRHTGVKRFTLPLIYEWICNLPIYNYSQPT